MIEENKKILNENISIAMKHYRKKKKLRQIDLSKKTNISLKYIQKIESRNIYIIPRIDTLIKIASGFDLKSCYFLRKCIEGLK